MALIDVSDMVYVVIGREGEYSSLQVWVAGVYTDKQRAIAEAEAHKEEDRANWAIWEVWNAEFGKRLRAAGVTHIDNSRVKREQIERLGMSVEPPIGNPDTEYTIACVPLNKLGRWDYK